MKSLKSVIAGQIPFSQQQIATIDKQSERKNVGFSSLGAELSNSLDYNNNGVASDGANPKGTKASFYGRAIDQGNRSFAIKRTKSWTDTQIDDVLNNNKTNVLDASTGIPTYNSSSNSAARQQAILRRSRSSSTSLLGG